MILRKIIARAIPALGLLGLAFTGWMPASAQVNGSVGCGISGASNNGEVMLEAGGMQRSYRLYVPENLPEGQPIPLVLSLHGFASNAAQQEAYTGWDALADEHGFIVAYPQGTGSPARWFAGNLGPLTSSTQLVDDVAFIRIVVSDIAEQNCLDLNRVYVNGMSNGGGMSNRLACDAADVFAAIGGVAGAYADFGDCAPQRAVPFIAFHGTDDNIVPYNGQRRMLPSIEAWALEWAERNHCDLSPEMLPGNGDVSGIRYTGCEDGADVVLYTIDGGGHTWPGSRARLDFLLGYTTQDINASAAMWDFFNRYQLEE